MPRPAGTPNKNKDRLLRTLKAEYGDDFDPIMKMAEIASNDDNDDTLKLSAWKEVAQYVYPKLKAVEHSSDAENPFVSTVTVQLIKPNNTDT